MARKCLWTTFAIPIALSAMVLIAMTSNAEAAKKNAASKVTIGKTVQTADTAMEVSPTHAAIVADSATVQNQEEAAKKKASHEKKASAENQVVQRDAVGLTSIRTLKTTFKAKTPARILLA